MLFFIPLIRENALYLYVLFLRALLLNISFNLAVELIIGEECVTTDTTVVVPVCLVDKTFGWTFVPWLDRVDDS